MPLRERRVLSRERNRQGKGPGYKLVSFVGIARLLTANNMDWVGGKLVMSKPRYSQEEAIGVLYTIYELMEKIACACVLVSVRVRAHACGQPCVNADGVRARV